MARWYLQATATFLISFNVLLVLAILFKVFENNECIATRKYSLQGRIVGGRATAISKYRFMAAIVIVGYDEVKLQCGATIISTHWVISAAHCVELIKNAHIKTKHVNIAAGHTEWKKGRRHKVLKMMMNKDFNTAALTSDSSLIKVKQPFDRRNEIPIALAESDNLYIVNTTAIVIGWGRNATHSDVVQDILYKVNVSIFDNQYCSDLYGEGAITDDMFCAGSYEGGKDACQFDSGGPIIINHTLIGIVSWGGECGEKTQPGVYAKVSHFIPWIKEVEKQEHTKIICGVECSEEINR